MYSCWRYKCFIGKTAKDCEKEETLVKQWTKLLMEQTNLFYPEYDDGTPGAPTNRVMPPGMEQHVITLYLNLNGQL